MIWILLIFGVISSVASAPDKASPLMDIILNDTRTLKLRNYRFVAECMGKSKFSKSICFAMYDVALSFDSKNMEFSLFNATYEEDKFCETLNKFLPDTPANDDSKIAFSSKAEWFKDTLMKEDGQHVCEDNCFFNDRQAYEQKLTAACQFLLNQYWLLQKLNGSLDNVVETPKNVEIKPASLNDTKMNVMQPDEQPIPAAVPVPEAAVTQSKIINDESLSKSANESVVTKQQPTAAATFEIPKTANSSEAPTKPLAQTATTQIEKTSKTTKSDTQKVENVVGKEEELEENAGTNLFGADDGNQADKDEVPEDPDQVEKENEAAKIPDNYPDSDDEEYSEDQMTKNNNNKVDFKVPHEPEPTVDDEPHKEYKNVAFEEDPDTNFFAYLCALMFLCVLLYIIHQNRHKLLALCLEGRRGSRRGRERSRGGSKAAYSKLDCNLEEAIMSKKSLSGKSNDVIY